MSRPMWIEFSGAVYHITARGNERKKIFLDDRDRGIFLNTIKQVTDRFHWQFHSYVLMGNHYHLLVETPEAQISRKQASSLKLFFSANKKLKYMSAYLTRTF